MIYMGTSALLKLVKDDEAVGPALWAFVAEAREPLIRHDVETLLTYDDRLLTAAKAHGLPIAAPA